MRTPEGKSIGNRATLDTIRALDAGDEVMVSSALLRYGDRAIDGLVFKELHKKTSGEFVDSDILNIMLRKWRDLREINARRRTEGRTTFSLPSTVRVYDKDGKRGIVMTDLTKGGKNQVKDLKRLIQQKTIPAEFSLADWYEIRQQVVRDLKIAKEENINIAQGRTSLDAWLIVQEEGKYTVYIVDVGHNALPYHSPHEMLSGASEQKRYLIEDIEMGQENAYNWIGQIDRGMKEKFSAG